RGVGRLLLVAKAHADQVLRIDDRPVESNGFLSRRERGVELSRAVPGDSELQRDPRRQTVDGQTTLVYLCGSLIPSALEQDVAERFEWTRRRRVEICRAAEIVRRGVQLVPALVRLASPQVREH